MIAAMNTISGDRVPVIICDECHEVIEDVAMAMAAMPASEGPPGEIQQVLHIHKANCHEALEEREGKCLPWLELQDYLASLADVVKFTSYFADGRANHHDLHPCPEARRQGREKPVRKEVMRVICKQDPKASISGNHIDRSSPDKPDSTCNTIERSQER